MFGTPYIPARYGHGTFSATAMTSARPWSGALAGHITGLNVCRHGERPGQPGGKCGYMNIGGCRAAGEAPGHPQQPWCGQTVAGHWDALTAGPNNCFASFDVGLAKCTCLSAGSSVYHGYGGEKHQIDRAGTTDFQREPQWDCTAHDTLECHKRTTFGWLDELRGDKGKFGSLPFFCGPKSTADIYGEKKVNTVVVVHNDPGVVRRGRKTNTPGVRSKPLYQIPQLNGTTITFKLKRDVKLFDLTDVQNAENIIEYMRKIRYEMSARLYDSYEVRQCMLNPG